MRAMLRGTVSEFDGARGLGIVTGEDGSDWTFHVIEIADGTRSIDVGQDVVFQPLPKFGRRQAGRLYKL